MITPEAVPFPHRLLGWRSHPESDNQPADWIIEQPDFLSEGKNAQGNPTASSLSVSTGICICGAGLAVADPGNNRVLLWNLSSLVYQIAFMLDNA